MKKRVVITVDDSGVLYLDIETDRDGKKIYEIGVLCGEKSHKNSSPEAIASFVRLCSSAEFLCGHNLFDHDLPHIEEKSRLFRDLARFTPIDTLPISLLFFNERTHHALPKTYKNEDEFRNDPVKDCELTRTLLTKIVERFASFPEGERSLFASLLRNEEKFHGFFDYLEGMRMLPSLRDEEELYTQILTHFETVIDRDYLRDMILNSRSELAYILALLSPRIEIKAHPPKVLYDYPDIVEKQRRLCYDAERLKQDLEEIADEIFGIPSFRIFPKLNPSLLDSNTLSQRNIIEAALHRESFLAILPTGGGKTFTFWLPAVIQASRYKSLTVVISPLQALIEDHIKNFEKKVANYRAVAISGFLTPQERADAITQVINGEADILYIAPESLRSNTIFSILKNRYVERFVIDEAHCLSTWGNDFRQDYYYICTFVRDLLDAKPFQDHIPVSCFTATAKPGVISDIENYFREGLGLELEEYLAKPERKNLRYVALDAPRERKYTALLELVQKHQGSTLVYIPTSTRLCDDTAERLAVDTGKEVRSFHSKLDPQEKMQILKDYILNEIDVIVATTAFGMGVDKADITQVIHYEPSDSLENYAQEAGRGARNEKLEAICPILYDEADLDKHFQTLRRSKVTVSEINSIFQVLKRNKSRHIFITTRELAHAAGWDVEDSSQDYATKIKTILLELEREGYIERERNRVRYFGDSVAADNRERLEKLLRKKSVPEEESWRYVEVLNRILGKGKDHPIEIDDIALVLGIERSDVALIVQEFIEAGIVGDSRDTTVELLDTSGKYLKHVLETEKALFMILVRNPSEQFTLKELNEALLQKGIIRGNESETILNLVKGWRSRGHFALQRINRQQELWQYRFTDGAKFGHLLEKRQELVRKLHEILCKSLNEEKKEEPRVSFSLTELHRKLEKRYSLKEIDRGLLFLHRQKVIRLLGGRFIHYAPMSIEKLEKMEITNKRYTKVEYRQRLVKHYQIKTEAIHIMGEYANRLMRNPAEATRFLQDYFELRYDAFKRRYKLLKEQLSRPITERRYRQIFEKLNDDQKRIISDRESRAIMILAGPGSGKTRVLVHKIASLVLTEDVQPEQFMMLTFSRSAVREFRSRLAGLLGESAYEMEISTFHAFALRQIGRTAEDGEVLHSAIAEAARQIRSGELRLPHREALVLDEYQDISAEAFDLVSAIFEASPGLRLIAVGDDDQCIMEYAGADPAYFRHFRERFSAVETEEGERIFSQYELLKNYRSSARIVHYSEAFIRQCSERIKSHPLQPHNDPGERVEVIEYRGDSLIAPALQRSMELLPETKELAILAYTNEEVLAIYSGLRARGVPARFLIDRPRFEVKDIDEIIYLNHLLNKEADPGRPYEKRHFEKALDLTEKRYAGSKNLPLLRRVVFGFLNESENLSASLWTEWLDEVELEHVEGDKTTRVTISTIHKSKGMEFESVILLAQRPLREDADLRLYYVGMTRAKERLSIFHRGERRFKITGDYCRHRTVEPISKATEESSIILIMGLSDIHLGFEGVQNRKEMTILAGEPLQLHPVGRNGIFQLHYHGAVVEQLSKRFHKKVEDYLSRGYRIKEAKVDFVVQWRDRDRDRELRHVLAQIELIREG